MANDRNMINAFDDAIERLATGEDLDSILKDYPDYADYLRDLLMISTRVAEVHNEDSEVVSAQSRGRDRLQQALQEKPKRAPRRRSNWFIGSAAAAVFVFVVGFGFLVFALSSPNDPTLDMTRTMIAEANSTTESLIMATNAMATIGANSTQVAMETTPLLINATATALPTQAPPTVEPLLDPFELTATALVGEITLTAIATERFSSDNGIIATSVASMPTFTPTISPIDVAQTTATALSGLFEISPTVDTNPVDGGIKTTSQPTSPTPLPSVTITTTPTVTTTSTPTPAPTQTAAPAELAGTPVADASGILPSPQATPLPALIPLTAGEIDDNADWDTYLRYRQEFMARGIPVRDIDVTGRQIITVVDTLNRPVQGAIVSLYVNDELLWESRTYADGRTMFLPNANSVTRINDIYTAFVVKDNLSTQFTLDRRLSTEWVATLPTTFEQDERGLDVLFLIDTTSSMSDEIMQLQNNILHISSEVDAFADNVDVRYGLVLYREHDNFEYLTRRHDFTGDVGEFQLHLNAVTANSGDNNPDWDEALNVGLDESLQQMSWHEDDTIKLIFLVADARPHLNHPLEPVTYEQSILIALQRGIKIHPIASSGLEQAGEYIFRQIAQVTMGHFIFLTYEDGVVGTTGDTRPEFNVGQPESDDPIGGYTVNQLSDIVLALIQEELAAGQLNRP